MRRLRVEDDRLRDDDRAVAGLRRAPPEVDVVAEDRQLLVEAAELVQDRTADQHPGGVDGQHLAHVVVLALVVLAALEARLATAGAREGDAELEQPPQRWPLPQLGPEDLGTRVARSPRRATPPERPGRGWSRRAGSTPTRSRRRARGRARRRRGNDVAPGAVTTVPNAAVSRSTLSSLLLVSTATTFSAWTRWPRIPSITEGSQRPPSWLTRSTATDEFTVVDPNGHSGRTVSWRSAVGGRCAPAHARRQLGRLHRSLLELAALALRQSHPRCRSARHSSRRTRDSRLAPRR